MAGGHSLSPSVRARLEHGFGQTMAGVRVDTSAAGRTAAAAIGARAYTEGERITLGHGESEHDLKLMAHEATHVVQNRRLGHRGGAGAIERTEIRRREVRPAEDSDSDDDRTYRMRDGRVIDLPDDMTRADAAKLEADGEAAKRHLGKGPPPQPVPEVHKPADRSKAKKAPPKLPPKHGRGRGAHAGGPRSVGAVAKLKPAGGPAGQYLFAKAGPVLARGIGKVGVLSRHEQTHNDAAHKVTQAEKAVVIPPSEGQSKSNSSQVGTVSGRPTPVVDENKGPTQLQQSLAENVPRTIEDVDNFKRDQKAQHVGAEVLKVVQTDKNAVVTTFADMEHTPPPQPPEHVPEALPPIEVAPPTAPMNLGQGAVPALLPEHTDVSNYTNEADARLKEEGVTQEQLDMVDSGDLAVANKEKKGLEKAAQTEPRAIQQFAQGETARVDHELQHEEKTERSALAGHHRQGLGRTAEQQKHAKSTLEKKRDEVAAKINGIYQTAQTSVKKKLDDLETKAMKRFDDGNAVASKAFEDNVNRELDAYKDDRYSGWFGWARKAKDWVLGMDDLPRVKAIFENNRRNFVETLNRLIADISADNKRVIQECKDELAKAKTDIKEYVDKLGPELKDIANKTAGEVNGKLDELDGFIRKKEEDLQKKLADKQQKAIQAIDDKIAKMKEAMSGALAKLGQLLLWAAKKFFKWALEQFGYSWSDIEAIIDRGVAVLKAIVTKPIQFVKNLIAAAKQGFLNFGKNFLTHLKDALFDWLTGSLEGLQLPETWDFKGIASVALQMLGLTWANIRGKLVTRIGEKPVKAMEAGFDLVVTLVRDGPMAAWEKLQDMGSTIKEAFVAAVKDFIVTKIITEAIKTVIAIFVPGAGIVKAVIAIYDTVVFFIQKAKQIAEMVGNFLSAIGEIASGNIQVGADALEKGLATALKLVINFLARFLHLDAITAKIRNAIQKIRDKVDNALERVVDWVVEKGKAVLAKVTGAAKRGVAAVANWWKTKVAFKTATGEAHTLYFEGQGFAARLMLASTPRSLEDVIVNEKAIDIEQRKILSHELKVITDLIANNSDIGTKPEPQQVEFQHKVQALVQELATKLAQYLGHGNLPASVVTFGHSGGRATYVRAEPLTKNPGNTTGEPAKGRLDTEGDRLVSQFVQKKEHERHDGFGNTIKVSMLPLDQVHLLHSDLHGPFGAENIALGDKSLNGQMRPAEKGAKGAYDSGKVSYVVNVTYFSDTKPTVVDPIPAPIEETVKSWVGYYIAKSMTVISKKAEGDAYNVALEGAAASGTLPPVTGQIVERVEVSAMKALRAAIDRNQAERLFGAKVYVATTYNRETLRIALKLNQNQMKELAAVLVNQEKVEIGYGRPAVMWIPKE